MDKLQQIQEVVQAFRANVAELDAWLAGKLEQHASDSEEQLYVRDAHRGTVEAAKARSFEKILEILN